jgi:hypothetical protein
MTVNQVVAYNLMRARRKRGWAQEETAAKLTAATGRKWTSATLSAAERTWETGRIRQFDANELVAFARVFNESVASFLIPPEGREGPFVLGTDPGAEKVDTLDVLSVALPMRATSDMVEAARAHLIRRGLDWSPGRADWHLPGYEEGGTDRAEGVFEPPAEGGSCPRLAAVHRLLSRALRDLEELQDDRPVL